MAKQTPSTEAAMKTPADTILAESARPNVIQACHLWKEYGDNVVLENIDVTVKEGEFITVVGTSGCGKTTFLKLLLGIEKPTRGALLLDGKTLPDEPNPDRGIVFQRYSVFPHLKVLENVMLGAELEGSPMTGAKLWKASRGDQS